MTLIRKKNPRRTKVRKDISSERIARLSKVAKTDYLVYVLLGFIFIVFCTAILSFDLALQSLYENGLDHKQYLQIIPVAVFVVLAFVAATVYMFYYQKKIGRNRPRAFALAGLFLLLLAIAKFGTAIIGQNAWATGTAIAAAMILTIAYEQRFALGMTMLYTVLVSLTVVPITNFLVFITMTAGGITCVFLLKDIRTRMKLLEVCTLAAVVVFTVFFDFSFVTEKMLTGERFMRGGYHALATISVGLIMQSILPVIEKVFRITTSLTLIDYSQADQPLLKRLAMEAPGTYSHSLLIGTIAEAAADAINRNGLLCRVGAYYHDIGKVNKPDYFVENEFGSTSKHKQLSPTMSQLIIAGHVKDGIELAKEYRLPSVLIQFIETHHGTTLIEYFYNEARKKQDKDQAPVSESEFRYPGPRPKTKEAAIVMLSDAVEGTVRALAEITPTRIETVVHNTVMKRLQDGQFDECDLSLRELSLIEVSMSKTLAAQHHGRIAYPKSPEETKQEQEQEAAS